MLLLTALCLIIGTTTGSILTWRAVRRALPSLAENSKAWTTLGQLLAQLPPETAVPRISRRFPLLPHRTFRLLLGADPIVVPSLGVIGCMDLLLGYTILGSFVLFGLALFVLLQPLCIALVERRIRHQTRDLLRALHVVRAQYMQQAGRESAGPAQEAQMDTGFPQKPTSSDRH